MSGKKYNIEFMLGAAMESNFVKSFGEASDSMKELQQNISKLSKEKVKSNSTKGVRDDLTKTRQAMEMTANAADKMKGFLMKSFAAIGGIYAARKVFNMGQEALNTFSDYEQGLANVKSVSGATAEELKLLGDEAKRLGATTAWTAKEVTDAETLLAQAGYSVNETIAALPGLLNMASADQIDLALATDIAAGTLKAFSLEAEDSARVADVLALAASATNSDIAGIGEAMKYVAPVSQSLKIDLEQTAAAIGALSDANIKGSQAGTVLRAGLARLASPAKAAQKVMAQLGFNAFDASGNMVPLHEMIGRLDASTKKLSNKERAAAITKIFGQEAMSGMLALMEQGPERLRSLTDELYNSQGAAEEMAKTRLDSTQGSFIMLKSAVDAAKLSIGEKLAPTIRNLTERATEKLPQLVDQFDSIWSSMTRMPSWQNADWLGKMQIAWDKLISSPFSAWWKSQGKSEFEKVATEIGKTIKTVIGGVVKEAFKGSGATQIMAAGALALPTINVGKGIFGTVSALKSIGVAGGAAGTGVVGATKAASLFGPSLALLTNPIGLTVAGVGALTLGVIAYKKHQEKARQELINMGGSLREAEDRYQSAADKAELTTSLSEEYKILNDQVKNNVGTAEELATAQQRMADITATLQDMFPQTLTNYDVEKGKMLEKLDLMEQMSQAELEIEKIRLAASVAEKKSKQGKLENEIGNLYGEVEKAQNFVDSVYAQQNAISEAIPKFQQYEIELNKIFEMNDSEERRAKIDDLLKRANELGSTVGVSPGHIDLLRGTSADLLKKLGETGEELNKALDQRDLKMQELDTAKSSYQELYDAQHKIIELDLGMTLEQAATNYKNMTDEEKARTDAALKSIDQINQQMKLLTDEPFTIQVQTLFDTAHQLTGVPQEVRQRYNLPSYGGLAQYANGGFANKASIFGEAGLEAAIPIDNRPRSHALLERVNQMMGHSSGSSYEVTISPIFNIGGDGNVKDQIAQASAELENTLNQWWENKVRRENRLSFR